MCGGGGGGGGGGGLAPAPQILCHCTSSIYTHLVSWPSKVLNIKVFSGLLGIHKQS